MNKIQEYFEKNRYVYLSGVLSKEECAFLTNYMFELKKQGRLVNDSQCPLSWSIYGDSILDRILQKLAKPLSEQLGIELYPTYTYARIYSPGEELKRHIDRESCEISGTLTLGHHPESEIWPISFSGDKDDEVGKTVSIDVGDMVMYRGNELDHWRPKYVGQWQVQVFFHFVDANGPHKDWKNDKRPVLVKDSPSFVDEMVQKESTKISTGLYNGVMMPSTDRECPGFCSYNSKFKSELAFSKKECQEIISYAKKLYPEKSRVGSDKDAKYAPEVRRVEEFKIPLKPESKWIFDKIVAAIGTANEEYYKYDLLGITHELQLLHYKADEKSFYDWHTDVGPGFANTRKISASIMLSEESDYDGGDLIVNNYGNNINSSKEIGSVNMFPSFLLHTVTPVTRGDRWVLVIWIHGSQRFK